MDCCREAYERAACYAPPWDQTLTASPAVLQAAERVYGQAAPWRRVARERQMPDGTWRGVFTMALLEGLNGAAYDSTTIRIGDDGREVAEITAVSLKAFLNRNMKDFISAEDREDSQIRNEPDIPHPRNEQVQSRMIFSPPVPVPAYDVRRDLRRRNREHTAHSAIYGCRRFDNRAFAASYAKGGDSDVAAEPLQHAGGESRRGNEGTTRLSSPLPEAGRNECRLLLKCS